MPYDPAAIEKKWQKYWQENATYRTPNISDKPKYYVLDMFPYPSGAGLHVGHPKGYTATDIISRYRHAAGYNVLHTMGWDAFGLPAENYAIKTGTHPKITTAHNIGVFKEQLLSLGFSYDWDREIDTTDPAYYRWTQWIFLKLWEKDLAYEAEMPVNWCPGLKAVLANEEVVNGKSEVGGHPVERRSIRQWVLRITEYADKLLEELDALDWPEGIKDMQRNWIGRSEGAEIDFHRDGGDETLRVFTTRLDTIFGVSFLVMAPDHADVEKFVTTERRAECETYIATAKNKSDLERTELNKEKTGVFTGSYVVNPYSGEKVPVWIADYVLGGYGTGAVMGVPAHDERDHAFAKKYNLPIVEVVAEYVPLTGKEAPREDVAGLNTAACSTVVAEHPEGGLYATLVWEIDAAGLPGGRHEAGETAEQAALREAAEEIGATDIASIRFVGSIVGHGYKARKETNCLNPDSVFHIRLASLEGMMSTAQEDAHAYRIEWRTAEEILSGSEFKAHHRRMLEMVLSEEKKCFSDEGVVINSGEFTAMRSSEAREHMIAIAEEKGFGNRKVQYKLRDWIFSRQRYWGEPIPLIHLDRAATDALPSLKITHDGIERIRHGSKTLETRALNPDEPHRYFGDIEAGQAIVLVDREQGTRHIVRVKGVRRWDNIETLYQDAASYEMLGVGAMEYGDFRDAYAYSDTYVQQIDANGMIGFEIEYVSEIRDAIDSYVVADYSLPLLLPETPDYEPSEDGKSPLARRPEWVETSIASNLPGKRETNTMPQWGASCWYYLRFMDPKNSEALASEETMKYWGMVDEYVGGAEHAVLHLLYARFWHRVLHDIGVVPTKEPFYKLTNVGLILGENNEKMSKSRGNVVNPNDVVAEYGADTLRLYEMFMGDFTDSAPWDTTKIIGMRRLLDRIYATVVDGKNAASDDMKAMKLLHKTVKKVGEDITAYKFNTAIAAINILVNEGCPADAEFAEEWKNKLVRILHPFAPHMAEECWRVLGNAESVYLAPWPEYEAYMIVDDEVTIAIQVDGKLRTTFTCLNWVAKEEVLALAYAHDIVKKWTDGKEIVREIFVPNKLLNIVTKG